MKINNYNGYSAYTSTNRLNQNAKTNKNPLSNNKSGKTDTLEISEIGKSKSALPKDVVAKIQEFAKEGAKESIYMTQGYRDFIKSYMDKNISPDRTALMAKASPLVPKLSNPKNAIDSFFKFYGLQDIDPVEIMLDGESYTASRKLKYVSIKDKHGDEILSWDTNNGWLSHSSREELSFYGDAANVYAEAFDAARAEMRANGEL